jgi:hypothetical protein
MTAKPKSYFNIFFLGFALMMSSVYFATWESYTWLICLILGILVIVVWAFYVYVENQAYYLSVRENTRYVRLAESLRLSSSDVRRTVELSMRASLRVWPELHKGPIKFLADTDVPLGFVAEFLNLSNNTYPCEIHKWPDGKIWQEGNVEFGECRYLANQVLDFFEQMDWVRRPNGGPNGARWSRSEIHPGILKVALEIPMRQELAT